MLHFGEFNYLISYKGSLIVDFFKGLAWSFTNLISLNYVNAFL